MQRRAFLKTGLAATGGILAGSAGSAMPAKGVSQASRFRLKYAPHFGMFKHTAGRDLIGQLEFASEQGFTAWEDHAWKDRPARLQERIARVLGDRGMVLGAFVATRQLRDLASLRPGGGRWQAVLRDVRGSVDAARRSAARWLATGSGTADSAAAGAAPGRHGIELLKRCAAVLEPHGMVLLLDPAYDRNSRAGGFARALERAADVCRGVGSPACKLRLDLYDLAEIPGGLSALQDGCCGQVAYLQCGDRPGRREPGTGCIDYRRIFRDLQERQFAGIIGMEHGNSLPGAAGERAVVDAYRALDSL